MENDKLPNPLTPPDCDLRGFERMEINGAALFRSTFWLTKSAEARCAAIELWWESRQQVPAGSLPDDDIALTRLAGYGRDVASWKVIRPDALYGWIICSDSRLYHPVVAEMTIRAWAERQKFRAELAAAAARKKAWRDKKMSVDGDVTEMSQSVDGDMSVKSRSVDGDVLPKKEKEKEKVEVERERERESDLLNTNTRPREPDAETSALLASPASVCVEKTPLAAVRKAAKPKSLTALPSDFAISDSVAAWAIKNGHTMLDDRLEHFKNWATAGAKRYADWDAAFRNAIAGDWAHINDRKPPPIAGRPAAFKPGAQQQPVMSPADSYELIFGEKMPDADDKQIIQGVLA